MEIKSKSSRLEWMAAELKGLQSQTLIAASTPLVIGTGLTLYTIYEAGGKDALRFGLGMLAAGSAYLAYRVAGLKKC